MQRIRDAQNASMGKSKKPKAEKGLGNETIPPSLKKYFFTDKSPPDLMNDYDVIGFDLDSIAKYNELGL